MVFGNTALIQTRFEKYYGESPRNSTSTTRILSCKKRFGLLGYMTVLLMLLNSVQLMAGMITVSLNVVPFRVVLVKTFIC